MRAMSSTPRRIPPPPGRRQARWPAPGRKEARRRGERGPGAGCLCRSHHPQQDRPGAWGAGRSGRLWRAGALVGSGQSKGGRDGDGGSPRLRGRTDPWHDQTLACIACPVQVSEGELEDLRERLRDINGMATVLPTTRAQVPVDYVLGVGGFDLTRVDDEVRRGWVGDVGGGVGGGLGDAPAGSRRGMALAPVAALPSGCPDELCGAGVHCLVAGLDAQRPLRRDGCAAAQGGDGGRGALPRRVHRGSRPHRGLRTQARPRP